MPGTDESTSTIDRSLALADRAWGSPSTGGLLGRFAEGWRESLLAAREGTSKVTPAEAHARLRRDHEGSARPDLSRVHPSWLVRALQNESPAVRAAVLAHGPPSIREALRRGMGTVPVAPSPARKGDPEAIGWALSFWTERLLGDLADRPDDPPVVVAITRLRPRDVARLVKVCGLAKHAFAIERHAPAGPDLARVRASSEDRVRLGFFGRLIGSADPRLVEAARLDLKVLGEGPRRGHSRLGLATFGRLLEAAETHRARWAMQHLPYPVVKEMKAGVGSALPSRALAAWEAWVLDAAWARLLSEGRLSGHRGDRT